MASNIPEFSHCCEICGLDGLTEDEFRIHTHTAHLEGSGICPFCGLTAVSPAELILHVNQAHLDFLTPETEQNISFIDDPSPRDRSENNEPNLSYCCELCGLDGLSEAELQSHTESEHIDGNSVCPFCDFTAESAGELILHVNELHLDILTPEFAQKIRYMVNPISSEFNNINGDNHWNYASYSNNISNHLGPVRPVKSNINLNASSKVNGGGEISPSHSRHGQGSPLRSNLDLKLKNSEKFQCPMCNFTSTIPNKLEEHVNRSHFDLTSPSVTTSTATEQYICPLCSKQFKSAPDLELHVNIEHRDILSPASPAAQSCPVCGIVLDGDINSESAARHVESHFPAGSPQPSDRAALREREQREFEMLRAQYGMDNQGNFKEQSVTNMQRAVYAGEMSVSDYYERTLDLRAAESCGIDDGSSVTRSIVPRVKAISNNATNVVRTLLCTCVDHYASSYGDRGWGCGYRNTQMIISSLLTHTGYNEKLYKLWQDQKPPRSSVPSISRIQGLIEQAWAQGFDLQGSEQLGSRLVNTRKWIGATEVVTLLSSLRIKCQLVDFHKPTGSAGTHPELFKWVVRYFENSVGGEFTPPLYLQHQGHSRTIMGVEVQRDGSLTLLVLDPSHSPQQMAQLGDTNSANTALRLLRKNESAMKAKQYQIVAVIGMIESEQEYQRVSATLGISLSTVRRLEGIQTDREYSAKMSDSVSVSLGSNIREKYEHGIRICIYRIFSQGEYVTLYTLKKNLEDVYGINTSVYSLSRDNESDWDLWEDKFNVTSFVKFQ